MKYSVYYIALVIAVITGISFGVGQNWWAMVWALLAGCWVFIALMQHRRGDRIEREFSEYVKAMREGKR